MYDVKKTLFIHSLFLKRGTSSWKMDYFGTASRVHFPLTCRKKLYGIDHSLHRHQEIQEMRNRQQQKQVLDKPNLHPEKKSSSSSKPVVPPAPVVKVSNRKPS